MGSKVEFDGVKSLDTYSISTCAASGIVKAQPRASKQREEESDTQLSMLLIDLDPHMSCQNLMFARKQDSDIL